jgi:hypothetical protein
MQTRKMANKMVVAAGLKQPENHLGEQLQQPGDVIQGFWFVFVFSYKVGLDYVQGHARSCGYVETGCWKVSRVMLKTCSVEECGNVGIRKVGTEHHSGRVRAERRGAMGETWFVGLWGNLLTTQMLRDERNP